MMLTKLQEISNLDKTCAEYQIRYQGITDLII